jgi:hypothetical protein
MIAKRNDSIQTRNKLKKYNQAVNRSHKQLSVSLIMDSELLFFWLQRFYRLKMGIDSWLTDA